MISWQDFRSKKLYYGDATHHIANRISKLFGYYCPPVPIDQIITGFGIEVRRVIDPGWSVALQSSKDKAVIWLREEEEVKYQRFSLAHSLYHLLAHPFGETRCQSLKGDKESLANQFAADLLIPLWLLDPVAHLANLPERFQVAPHILNIQLAKCIGYPVKW